MDAKLAELILTDREIAYAITDRELNVIEVGGEVDLLHFDQDSWLGCSLIDLVPELVGSEAALADILADKLPSLEMALVNRNISSGETIYLTIVELPRRSRGGEITGLIHVVDDVTETGLLDQSLTQSSNELRLLRDQLTRQNLELAAANAELKQLDEMKSMFVSVAAHELRTPVTSISGFVEVLLDAEFGSLTNEQREYLEIVYNSARRMLISTNNLLDVTRIETGRIELVLQPTDLPALVKATATEFETQLENKSQRLTLDISPDLPLALCDRTRAAQMIDNLLSNASKYSPQGGQITVRLAPATEEGFLQLSVQDNGVGIPIEDQDKLFTRFFRAQNAAETGASGAGLGLYITRCLIELHGGRIWFESRLDQGSTFFISFPLADQATQTSE
jgi:signal transduction histidine kinase